ncbi:MAG: PAS domain S-box protein [Candidatus Eisenbacteria bacterium]
MTREEEERELRAAGLQTAQAILSARKRSEAQLLAAKLENEYLLAMSRATLESTTDAILVTDDQGRVTDFNSRFIDLWQLRREAMESRDHRVILEFTRTQVVDSAAYQQNIDHIYATSPPETFDVFELVDGRLIERFTRLQVVEGKNVGRVWSFRDITAHRRAEREHAHFAAIVTSSNDAIISKTLDGIITSWNPAAERMFGYAAAEAIGQPIAMLVPPAKTDEEHEFMRRLRSGGRIDNITTVRLKKGGGLINVALTISPVRDESGNIIGASKTARDVTEREQLLASEQAARARAEEANRLKDEFLATVSHELRTPLNAILGWAQLLGGGSLDKEQSRHAIGVIERNALTQAQVIEDILDISRIITGKLRLNIQSLMPAAVIESALESIRPAADAKRVELRPLLDPAAGPISGDPSRLQQIVWNLLANALKFTGSGGRVEIRLERINSHIEIVVTDSGEGIAAEFLPYVFDRFRQADGSSSRDSSGLGLGLAIVRHLVELHGGRVNASSPGKGQGATFTVRLPLRVLHEKLSSEDRVHPTVASRESLRRLEGAPRLIGARILVVDDEPDSRELLRHVLETCGAEVQVADSAGKGLEVVLEWRPDLIVSDIGMPGEDGYTFIRRVREWEQAVGARIPAVALTAYARSEDRMRALKAGFQVHVSKPIEPMEFALVVAGIIQS